jgi:hypothetical protein
MGRSGRKRSGRSILMCAVRRAPCAVHLAHSGTKHREGSRARTGTVPCSPLRALAGPSPSGSTGMFRLIVQPLKCALTASLGGARRPPRRGGGLGRSRRSRLCRLVRTHAGHRCRRPPQTVGPTSASPGLPFCLLVRSSRTPASASESSGAGHGTEGVGQEEEGIEQARQSGTSGSCPALMEEKAARYHRTVVAETINARGGDVRPGPVLAVVRETRTHQGAA